MGTYTEMVVKACIKSNISDLDRAALSFLFNDGASSGLPEKPNHPFFKCDRWAHIGRTCSFYHIPWSDSKYEKDKIFSRCDIKNYSDEIEMFFDYLRPLIDGYRGDSDAPLCIGYIWYEEEAQPTLIFL
jgi:hypothetical protein